MWSLCLPSLYSVSVVCHDSAIKECKRKLAEAYALNKRLDGSVTDEDLKKLRRKLEEDENPESNTSRTRQKLIGWTPGYCFLSWQAWHNADGLWHAPSLGWEQWVITIWLTNLATDWRYPFFIWNPLKLDFTWLRCPFCYENALYVVYAEPCVIRTVV